MKTRDVKLVLAYWADVEPNDVVWHENALYRITGESYHSDATIYHDREYYTWPAEKRDDYDYYGTRELTYKLTDQVPVVVP